MLAQVGFAMLSYPCAGPTADSVASAKGLAAAALSIYPARRPVDTASVAYFDVARTAPLTTAPPCLVQLRMPMAIANSHLGRICVWKLGSRASADMLLATILSREQEREGERRPHG